ncbi:MAG: redoxin family protein, partial [Rikenellaceae bacterium]
MRKIIYLIVALYVFAGCTPLVATINLTTIGAKDSITYLSLPIETFPLGETDTIVTADKSTTTITVHIHKLAVMNIENNNVFTSLIIEPGKTYDVKFDYSLSPVVQVNDTAQMMLNKIFADKNFYKYEFVNDYTAAPLDTIGSKMMANFEELINKDLAPFSQIKMSDAKREYITKHVELFWMGSLSKAIRHNYFDLLHKGTPMINGYGDLWQTIYTKYPISASMTPSHLMLPYANTMKEMQNMISENTNIPKTIEQYWQARYDAYYKLFTDKSILETVLVNALYLDCLNNSTCNKAILKHIDKFNEQFPSNPYNLRFNKFIKEITDFNKRIEGDFSPEVKFVENGDSIKTLKEVIATFKGKPVFIDFWFSSCHPCREQFKYGEPLKKFLKENGIEMLYFSIDREEKDWHNTIKFFELDGNHI